MSATPLNRENMEYISSFMTVPEMHLPSALTEIPRSGQMMRPYGLDRSFARQMKDIVDGEFQPDAYFVTANSAIPVADSIRGFYAELGEDSPPVYDLTADQLTSRMF